MTHPTPTCEGRPVSQVRLHARAATFSLVCLAVWSLQSAAAQSVDELLSDFRIDELSWNADYIRIDYHSDGESRIGFLNPQTGRSLTSAYDVPSFDQRYPITSQVSTLVTDSIRVDFVRNGTNGTILIPQRAFAAALALQLIQTDGVAPDSATALQMPVVNRRGDDFFIVDEDWITFLDPTSGRYYPAPAALVKGAAANHNFRFPSAEPRSSVYIDDRSGLVIFSGQIGVTTVGVIVASGILLMALGGFLLWSWARRRRRAEQFNLQLMEAREEERTRLAADLHDGPVQELALAIRGLNEAAEQSTEPAIATTSDSLGRIKKSLRDTCNELRPVVLDRFGLAAGINALASTFMERHPTVALTVAVDGASPDHPPKEVATGLYRIVQECLNNIGRHADASRASVHVHITGERAELEVADDGRGFATEKVDDRTRAGHFGLVFADRRVASIGGRMTVQSAANSGTKVRVSIPLRKQRAYRGNTGKLRSRRSAVTQ